jgi:hypothetical protein
MTEQERQALNARLRSDPRVLAALKAKPVGFGARLTSQELAALGYQVPPNFTFMGNPTPRNGRTDYAQTGALLEDQKWISAIPIAGGATMAGLGALGAAGAGPFAGGSAAAGNAAVDAVPAWESGGYANAAALGATPAGGSVAGATGGSGLSNVIKSLTSTSNIPSLIGLGTSLLGGMGGNGSQSGELDRIKQITEARMRRVDPLHQAITSLAMSRLPTNMQRPVPDVPLPEQK